MRLGADDALARIRSSDHGVLATLGPTGPDVVPVCFSIDRTHIAIPVDSVKPKSSTRLQRVRNLEADPRATLLCEGWDPQDWNALWWVRARLKAEVVDDATCARLEASLRARYPQYVGAVFVAVLTLRIESVVGWAASH